MSNINEMQVIAIKRAIGMLEGILKNHATYFAPVGEHMAGISDELSSAAFANDYLAEEIAADAERDAQEAVEARAEAEYVSAIKHPPEPDLTKADPFAPVTGA